ncbi:MAG TPA: hypothetical protein VJT73_06390, partial [Polyangiaceae bacterium]|nr:hypothetical protein [Polyangiaceae bacterium]
MRTTNFQTRAVLALTCIVPLGILASCSSDESTAVQALGSNCSDGGADGAACQAPDRAGEEAARAIREGRNTFRYDTFGDEAFWTGTLQLNSAIEGAAHGGVGAGVTPKAALGIGLKVDADALPPALAAQIVAGQVNLDDPATTIALLGLDAV